MADSVSVMVGVRVRPFNEREKNLNAVCCIDTDGPMTILNDMEAPAEGGRPKDPKKFTFDSSFWSHDGFRDRGDGYMEALPGSKYADQAMVFEAFGKKVLDSAWEGYHCCLFAYGQTGAGKSYSMVGYGNNSGIVPQACAEIYHRIAQNKDPNLRYEITVSMVEIYNETVQDLLVAPKLRPRKGLEIHESQQLGIYIQDCVKRPVASYEAIEGVLDEGTGNRTVGSTLMNATSSRAHTVLTIEFKQVSCASGTEGVKISMINLVDLAGSEKADQSGATGDRLKEGCAINKSLSALGNVIEKLADRSTGKLKAGAIIPYRDSKLTRLLQNALGGSSKTIMICAVSPASSNYEETLSTLRYADRAKRIKNAAVVNEDPQAKLIRQLREENAKLKDMGLGGTMGGSPDQTEALNSKQGEVTMLEDALKEMQKSFADKLSEAQAREKFFRRDKVDLKKPHITNLNEDPLLTNKLQFAFKEGSSRVGRNKPATEHSAGSDPGAPEPDIALAGPGIHQQHAVVSNTGGKCVLSTVGQAAQTTFVNGENSAFTSGGSVALTHGDRVVFGQCIFVFVDPAVGTAKQLFGFGKVSHAMARKEIAEKQGDLSGPSKEELEKRKQESVELERRVKEAESAKRQAEAEAEELVQKREEEHRQQMELLQREWDEKLKATTFDEAKQRERMQQHEEDLQRAQRVFDEKQRAAEEAAARQIMELEQQMKTVQSQEQNHKQHDLDMQILEERLMFTMPLVKEANLIASELEKPYTLETKMHVEPSSAAARGAVTITAAVSRNGIQLYEWAPETLENRVFLMRELLERCAEEGIELALELLDEEDPFWDPVVAERLIGVAQVLLAGLAQQVENELDARILSTDGQKAGTLRVELWPLAKDGTEGVPDEEAVDPDNPEELIGQRMHVLVRVVGASDLPYMMANDVRVDYDWFIEDKPYRIEGVKGLNMNPTFSYEQRFVQDPVTSRFLEYLRTRSLVFRVYGHDSAVLHIEATQKNSGAVGSNVAEANGLTISATGSGSAAPLIDTLHSPEEEQGLHPATTTEATDTSVQEAVQQQQPETQGPITAPSLGEVRRGQEKAAASASAQSSPNSAGQPDDKKKSKMCAIL